MSFIEKKIENYALAYSEPENPVLSELSRETHLNAMHPQMLSGHLQGIFLSFLSSVIRPDNILEVGTYTGYSAICLAQGLTLNGILHSIDINEELRPMAEKFIGKAGLENKIVLHSGDAIKIIPRLNAEFDLVFIDADKENYSNYFDLVFDKIRNGGLIVADNALWDGKVLSDNKDKETQALHDYNNKVLNDWRVENILLPIRDGLMIARKIS